jgi:hypothetical protein
MAFPPLVGFVVESVSPLLLPVLVAVLTVLMSALIWSCDRRVAATR